MRPVKTISSAALFLVSGAVASLIAQEPVFRVRVDEVIVPFSVRDNDGRLVPGLAAEDFTLLEDGVVQTISEFSDDPVGLSVALVIDTGLKKESLEAIAAAIPAMVAAFGDFDEVSVYRFDNAIFQVLDFAVDQPILDHERLRDALDVFTDLQPTIQFAEPAANRLPPQLPTINGVPIAPRATPPLDRDRRVLHDAIYTAARDLSLRAEDRRRVIIVITDGTAEGNEVDVEEVQQALLEAEVQVYPIGLNAEFFVRWFDSLDRYANLTGGTVYDRNSDSLQATFAEATGQARNQYLVTYVSNNLIPPNEIPFREIEIRSDPDYEIDHRLGYYQVP